MRLLLVNSDYYRTPDGKFEVEVEGGRFYVYLASDPDDADCLNQFDSFRECRVWIKQQYDRPRERTRQELEDAAVGAQVRLLAAPQVVFKKTAADRWVEQPRPGMRKYYPRLFGTGTLFLRGVDFVRA